jgi:hypothetical protein
MCSAHCDWHTAEAVVWYAGAKAASTANNTYSIFKGPVLFCQIICDAPLFSPAAAISTSDEDSSQPQRLTMFEHFFHDTN